MLFRRKEQGAPRQREDLEWMLRQATQVAGIITKQLVVPDCRCQKGPEPVLQCRRLQATKIVGGVRHPVHSRAVSPQPHVTAASLLGQQGLILPGKHARLPITVVMRVYLPGSRVGRGRLASDLPYCSARKGHRFRRGG